jgi:hypothetical protein
VRRLDDGGDALALFDDDALDYFPKCGLMKGKSAIAEFFSQLGQILGAVNHDAMFLQHPRPRRHHGHRGRQ